jgi:hypothetical protein
LLRDQIEETRELRETVTLTNMALSQLSKDFKAQQQTTPLQNTTRRLHYQPPVPAARTLMLQQLVVLGADGFAIYRLCYEWGAHFARLSDSHPLLFDLEQLP